MVRTFDGTGPFRPEEGPFLIPPKGFYVTDGDTIGIFGHDPYTGRRGRAFSVRLRSIMAPEVRRGPGPVFPDDPGEQARAGLKSFLKGMGVEIHPFGYGPHRRILGDVWAVPYVRGRPVREAARSCEAALLACNLVSPREGEAPPVARPAPSRDGGIVPGF